MYVNKQYMYIYINDKSVYVQIYKLYTYIHTYIYQLRHVLSLQEDSTENLKKYGMVSMSRVYLLSIQNQIYSVRDLSYMNA